MHADQVRKRSCLHFFHHPCAMNFYSALTYTKFVRDDFVRFAGNDKVEDFMLSFRQSIDASPYFRMFLTLAAAFLIRFQRFADAIEEVLIPEWLLNEVDSTFLHCLDGHRYIAVARNEYDW